MTPTQTVSDWMYIVNTKVLYRNLENELSFPSARPDLCFEMCCITDIPIVSFRVKEGLKNKHSTISVNLFSTAKKFFWHNFYSFFVLLSCVFHTYLV